MTMAARLSGYAFLDANLDGMRATGWDQLREYGIPNVSLWLFDCNDMPIKLSETNDAGYYAFENLELGSSYYVNAQLPILFDFGPVWIGNVGGDDVVLTSPGVDNAIDPATGSTPCFEMTEEEGVVSIGLTLLGGGGDGAPASQPTLRPSATTTTSFGESISPSILASTGLNATPSSPPQTAIVASLPTVSPSSTPSNPPMQSSFSSSSSPTTFTPMPSSTSSSTTTLFSPTLPGIQYAIPSIPLLMKLNGIDRLEDEDKWLSCTAQYIESYFNDATNDSVYDVIIDLFMDAINSTTNTSSSFKTRQRHLRRTALQQNDEVVSDDRILTTNRVGRTLLGNDEPSTEITYNQQSTYRTANPQTYDGMYVASIPFMEATDRGRYIAALWELSPYYKDVTSIEPPRMFYQSNINNDNNSSLTTSSTSAPMGEEGATEKDVKNGGTSVDNSSISNDVKESPMLYVVVAGTIAGVAIFSVALFYTVRQRRKQERHIMDHEFMSTVGNGPASSGCLREVKENDVAMEDLESIGDGDIDGNATKIAAIIPAAVGGAAISVTASRRRSSKRSRKAEKSFSGGGRRVNDSSLTPIPENPLSPSSSFGASATVVLNILAPPGKLGVIVDTPPQGGCAYVAEIRDSCPIREDIHLDDRIIAVDDKDVQRMSATTICKLLERKSENAQRKITVLREASHFDGMGSSEQNRSLHLPAGPMGGRNSNSDHAQAGSLTDSNAQSKGTREERIEVVAPSGRLGVVLLSPDPPVFGPSYICSVSEDSPLKDLILMGDKIITVDDVDVRFMSAMNVSQLLGSKSSNTARKIAVLRHNASAR